MEYIETFPEEKLSFNYSNPFQEELGRLSEYQGAITIPRKYYVVAPRASLVANNYHVGLSRFKRVILESLPRVGSIGPIAEAKLALRTLAPKSHSISHPAISLVHRQASNYGHWLMDYLPRALAALHFRQESGDRVKVIVPGPLNSWQRRSLELIGIESEDLISVNLTNKTQLNMKLDLGIFSRSHSYYFNSPQDYKDALSPLVFTTIKEKIFAGTPASNLKKAKKKIFILRKSASDTDRRFIINETEVKELLTSYGFVFVYLEDLTFDQQVALFSESSHVIAVHGSGLTNLMFTQECNVLELFSSGTGIKPEYWQLTSMMNGFYSHVVVNTQPPYHDLHVPVGKIRSFLQLSM